MKPSVQKIVAKLAKEQEKKVEKVELGLVENIEKEYNKIKKESDSLFQTLRRAAQDVDEVSQKASALIKRVNSTDADVDKLKQEKFKKFEVTYESHLAELARIKEEALKKGPPSCVWCKNVLVSNPIY